MEDITWIVVGVLASMFVIGVISRLRRRIERLETLVEQRLGKFQAINGEITSGASRAPETATPGASPRERLVPSSAPLAPRPRPEVARREPVVRAWRRRACPQCGYESPADASECESCRYTFGPPAAEAAHPATVAQAPAAPEATATRATGSLPPAPAPSVFMAGASESANRWPARSGKR